MKLTFYVRDTKDSSEIQPDPLTSGTGFIQITNTFVSVCYCLFKLSTWFSGFRSVSFTLRTDDVLSTVMNVLKSCSLPVEHMTGLKSSSETSKCPTETGVPFYRPIKWDKSYYTFTGYRDPEQELQQAGRVEPTLRWVILPLRSDLNSTYDTHTEQNVNLRINLTHPEIL